MSRYTLLLDDVTINSFAIERDEAIVELRVPDDPACLGRHGNELALAFIARVFFESLPRGWAPRRLSFAHAAPPVTRGLVSYFRTSRITFGCGLNRLVLGVEDLDRPIAGSDAALLTLLDEQAERLVASHANPNDLWLRIRREIRAALPDGAPRLERIAAAIGMSPRSLQRRLDERNTGFLDLVDAIRRDLALLHLGNEALALTEIAYLVGYSDTGTFIRAFRRWTGLTPAAYRKRSRSSLA